MAMTIHLDVVSAEESLFSGPVEFLTAPAEKGEVGIYPRHAQLLARLRSGLLKLHLPSATDDHFIFISGGLLEVQPNLVSVLADTALRGMELDEARAYEAKQRAEEALRDSSAVLDLAQAQAELADAVAQLAAIQKLRKNARRA